MKRELKISQIFTQKKPIFKEKSPVSIKDSQKKIITSKSTLNKLSNDGLHLPFCKVLKRFCRLWNGCVTLLSISCYLPKIMKIK